MGNRVYFGNRRLPYLLLAPQLLITAVFFLWPAAVALSSAFFIQNPLTGSSRFVLFRNFTDLLQDDVYLSSFWVTGIFSGGVTLMTMAIALWLAVKSNALLRGRRFYQALLTWPYAIAPAVAGVLWLFLFAPSIGIIAQLLSWSGLDWNYNVHGNQAMALVIVAGAWRQIAYNFLFFLAGLQALPASIMEAAVMDGAGRLKRFWTITVPLLSPTIFFLLVINIVYSLFETFGLIDTVTSGGPSTATNILVYQVFQTGFQGQDLGGSAAQSVVLMALVIFMTFIQFRFIERQVSY